ncbi:MAG: hypothetical protein ABJG88_02610 [Litorimonas sp.]
MQPIFKTLLIAGTVALAIPNIANARGYKTTITSPLTTSVKIEVVMSEDMQHRANNLPKKLRDRSSGQSRGIRKGFTGNGFFGDRELDILSKSIEDQISRKLEGKGVVISEDAPVVLRITLEDAKNNRPTSEQLRRELNISFQSFGLGGAELSADLINADGTSLGTMHYKYYANTLQEGQQFFGTWSDAKETFGRFARKATKTLVSQT